MIALLLYALQQPATLPPAVADTSLFRRLELPDVRRENNVWPSPP